MTKKLLPLLFIGIIFCLQSALAQKESEVFLLIVGIVPIHAELCSFVVEHGTGGNEYSFIFIAALTVIAASIKKSSAY